MADQQTNCPDQKPVDQETYLNCTSLPKIILRGTKKVITELTSLKTLFLAFLCVALWFNKIGDTVGIVGCLATLGVKEIPSEVFNTLISRFSGKQ